jgi:cytochrome c oxidase subunit 1
MPLFMAGVNGMNRRINEYTDNVEVANIIASLSAFFLGTGFLVFVGNLGWSAFRGKAAGANPWRASTLEWQTTSPPPAHDFDEIPEIVGDPYPYGEPGATHVRAPAPAPVPSGGGGR